MLLKTVIDEDSLEVKTNKVLDACQKVVDFLKQNVVKDLKTNFYEEKLKLYNSIYFDFIQHNLINGYPCYTDILNSITHEYIELRRIVIDTFDFSKYTSLTTLYKDIQYGVSSQNTHFYFTSSSVDYISHCAELLIEEIQNMLSKELFKEESNVTRYRRIRKLTYVLKRELRINIKTEKI